MADLSDIFKSYDIRGKVGTELTPAIVRDVGRAFADWLPKEGIVAVGRDMRLDSNELAQAFIEGLTMQGRAVWDVGEVTSDMVYFGVGRFELAGGAVITASHNPGADNGIKLYRDQVIAVGLDTGLDEIRDRVLAKQFKPRVSPAGIIQRRPITKEWVEHSLAFAPTLKPFHIAIDAGNGMAGAILPAVLSHIPVAVEEMYFKPDGRFPNHEANPQNHENLKDLIEKIRAEHLDFGIAFDGDGDRAVFVDDRGRPVHGSDIITIISRYYINKYPNAEIVHDVRTSRATTDHIRSWGGKPVRTKAGRVSIGKVMRERGAPFGGETTGHLFFKENYDADSGLIAAMVVMQALSDSLESLSQLVDMYRSYHMIPETNFKVADKEMVFDRLRQTFHDGEHDTLDGLTVNYGDCWFNVRASNTEPVIRLNAEAKTREELDSLVKKLNEILTSK
jgi:phosphomannomutase